MDLIELEKEQGAHFREYSGQQVATDYGEPGAEYAAARERTGLLDLSWRRLLRFTGEDRAAFLHSMTTNHVLGLEPGRAQHNTCCDATGHLVGVFRLWNTGDALWADLHPGCAEEVVALLDKHLIMEEMEIAELHSAWGMLSLQGPAASQVFASAIPEVSGAPLLQEVRTWIFNGKPAYLIGSSHTGATGVDIVAPEECLSSLWERLLAGVQETAGRPVGLEALQTLRIEAGIPWWAEDLDHSLLMLEAGLEDAIHYDKGCYLGQETLARIHFRGHTNRQLTGLFLGSAGEPESALPPRGTRLLREDRDAGWITSATFSPRLQKSIALGLVRREYLAPGTTLRTETGEEATVHALPFL